MHAVIRFSWHYRYHSFTSSCVHPLTKQTADQMSSVWVDKDILADIIAIRALLLLLLLIGSCCHFIF